MIIRQPFTRQGRQVAALLSKSWTRSLTTEVNYAEAQLGVQNLAQLSAAEAIKQDSVLNNEYERREEIISMLSQGTSRRIPHINEKTHITPPLDRAEVKGKQGLLSQQKLGNGRLGASVVNPPYNPSSLISDPPSPSDITLELLLASQSHLGHATSLWNPVNSRYIFGIRQGIHIISLDVTASHLRRACRVISGVAEHGGLILFVGTRPGQDQCVVRAAQLAGGCHLFERWTPGSITNGPQILGHCKKKIVDEYDRVIKGFDKVVEEQPPLKPDLVVCLNPLENWVMLHECSLNAIPTMGIIDTDANPTWVTYPIPANDDSLRCVQVIAGVLGRAAQEGQAIRREKAKEGIVTYTPISLDPRAK